MQDLLWVGLAALFYALSAWFVGFSDRLMPTAGRSRADAHTAAPAAEEPMP